MSFAVDPEIESGVADLFASLDLGDLAPMAIGDVASRRAIFDPMQRAMFDRITPVSDVTIEVFDVPTSDGSSVSVRWYTKAGGESGPAVLYAHGSGMIASSVELYDPVVASYVSAAGVPFLSVGYRKAPEFPAPIPVTDLYAAFEWLVSRAHEWQIDVDRLAVMGDSGGGGVAASMAIYARDHGGPAIAKQILIYPMLDDRNTVPDPTFTTWLPWSYDDNITGWSALLGDAVGGPDVDPYGAAARVADFQGLPPAYIEVGELDIFRDENIAYANGLLAAGISTELHVIPGAPHAFEAFVPSAAISRRSADMRAAVLRSL